MLSKSVASSCACSPKYTGLQIFGGILATSLHSLLPAAMAKPCSIALSPIVSSRRVGTLNTILRSGRRGSTFLLFSWLNVYKQSCVVSTA